MRDLSEFVRKCKDFFGRFIKWKRLKIREFLLLSIVLNGITTIIKFIFGMATASIFLGLNASYYFVLCIARIILLQGLQRHVTYNSQYVKNNEEKKAYGVMGKFIILLGFIYFLISLKMYWSSEAIVYTGYIVYLIALVSFSKLGIAIYGVYISKNLHEPHVAALRVINFADALVSLVVTQATLIELGNGSLVNHNAWNAYLGFAVSLLIMVTGRLFGRRVAKILE